MRSEKEKQKDNTKTNTTKQKMSLRKKIIIHKYIMKQWNDHTNQLEGINYLCNWAVEANWKKTDITNRKVNCKNCKREIQKFNKRKLKIPIEQIIIETY